MKICTYCGDNNPNEAQTCADCGSDLPAEPGPQTEPAHKAPRKVSTPVTLKPSRSNKLSYSLGQVLVELLSENWADFLNFAQNADPRDAGQDAALKCLDRDLGETVARFLGPGEWRPNRKAIADLWNQKRS